MKLRILVFSTLVFAPSMLCAQPAVQESAAMRAEAATQWDEAVRLYRAVLTSAPDRSELWVRIADIEARRGDLAACVSALEQGVAAAPGSPALYARLSQAYATAGSGAAALHAIDGALALDSKNPDYLRARATLATWVGDYRGAQASYRLLASQYPHDPGITLAFARVSSWAGDTDQGARQFKRYLEADSADPEVWLELAKTELWRGNYAAAMQALERYRGRLGTTDKYLAQVAAVLANGGQPIRAENLLRDLLARTPDNYELTLTHSIALARQHRAKEAFETLDTVRRLSPERQETRTTESVLRTLLASTAESPFSVYSDSDNLQVQRFAPRAVLSLQTSTLFSAGYERTRLDARSGSGLDALDGSSIAHYDHVWAGAAQRFGRLTLNGELGYATAGQRVSTTYDVGVDVRLADSIRFTLSRALAPFVVSPRTVDLGLSATSHHAQVAWMPGLQYQLLFDGSFQELSDGNQRWEITVSPRRTVARTASFNLDLGATAYRLQTTRDLDHGYYDPRRYEYYAATIYPYLKLRENVGVAMSVAVGAQRDNTSPAFHFGGNFSSEATFGIYRSWVVKVKSSASLNSRLDSGAFRGFSAGAALVRRF
jgi:tetratricopeptide (TPR) repeat protein